MSAHSYILAIIYFLVIVLGLSLSIKTHTIGLNIIPITLIVIVFAILIVYDTNCLTSGNCTIWSLIRTIIYAILPILAVISLTISLFQKSQAKIRIIQEEPKLGEL
jgi:hypothetical protein